MANLENNDSENANIYEDEINLMDYFFVLWKRKWFILLASALPALVVGLAVFLWPRDYKLSYTYNIGLDEKTFNVLEDKFYSTENLEKLVGKLQKAGFDKYAEKLAQSKTEEELKELVSFETSPSYFKGTELSKAKNLEELQKMQQVKGTLLEMHLVADAQDGIREMAWVYRENFEQVLPLYSVRDELRSKVIGLRATLASIEGSRHSLNLGLQRKISTLKKLKSSGSTAQGKLPSDLVLQFNNVGGNSAFLPLAYQVQAAETQIIDLEEQIRANKEKYDYSAALLTLNEKLLSHVEKSMPAYYTLGQFRAFLAKTLAEQKGDEPQIQDYLKAYIKKTDNKIASTLPLVEKPKIYPLAKGTVKKGAIAFAIALMISIFACFVSEGLKNRTRAS